MTDAHRCLIPMALQPEVVDPLEVPIEVAVEAAMVDNMIEAIYGVKFLDAPTILL